MLPQTFPSCSSICRQNSVHSVWAECFITVARSAVIFVRLMKWVLSKPLRSTLKGSVFSKVQIDIIALHFALLLMLNKTTSKTVSYSSVFTTIRGKSSGGSCGRKGPIRLIDSTNFQTRMSWPPGHYTADSSPK